MTQLNLLYFIKKNKTHNQASGTPHLLVFSLKAVDYKEIVTLQAIWVVTEAAEIVFLVLHCSVVGI